MRVPYTNFKTRIGDDNAVGGCTFIGGEWKDVDTAEIFENKKVVVFALPGAFTPTCSSQQLPGYEKKYHEIKALGIDEVYCLSVNDAFVMNAWFRDEKIEKVKGEVVKVFEEPGKNNASDDDDPFTVSDADTMINFLKNK